VALTGKGDPVPIFERHRTFPSDVQKEVALV
jgi:hypothetical protein